MTELVSRAAYARMRGCSHTAVNKYVNSGRIPLVNGMIDPELADAAWPREQAPIEFPGEMPSAAPVAGSKAEEELLERRAKRKLAEHRVAEVEEESVSRAEVREAVGGMIIRARSLFLMVPGKLGVRYGAAVRSESELLINGALQELSHEVV